MIFFRPAVCAVLMLAAGCKARAPALEVACVKHQDCALVALASNCCDACEARVGNTASVDAFRAWCGARETAEPCPRLDCNPPTLTAMCDDGRCIARPGVHPL